LVLPRLKLLVWSMAGSSRCGASPIALASCTNCAFLYPISTEPSSHRGAVSERVTKVHHGRRGGWSACRDCRCSTQAMGSVLVAHVPLAVGDCEPRLRPRHRLDRCQKPSGP